MMSAGPGGVDNGCHMAYVDYATWKGISMASMRQNPEAPAGRAAAATLPPEPGWELRDTSVEYVLSQVEAGLPAVAITRVHTELGLKQADFIRLAGIRPRTLMRRRAGGDGRLTPAESAPVMRYALLLRRATDVLGSVPQATAWLKAPRAALGGRTPLEYASTEFGAREVDELLGRLEQGVFS